MKVINISNEHLHRGNYKNNHNDYSQYSVPVLNSLQSNGISFKGQPNADRLGKLIKYGVHCMFCDKLMIYGKEFNGFIKSGLFNQPSSEVMNKIGKYEECLENTELKVFQILKEYSQIFPDKTINEIVQLLKSSFERRLIQKQTPVFNQIANKSKALPEEYQMKIGLLMEETKNKIMRKPVKVPFSSYEFQYKLKQMKKYALGTDDTARSEVIDKLISISEKFSQETNNQTQPHQIKILKKIKKTLIQNNFKDDKKFNRLLDNSFKRLYGQPMIMQFKKKSFTYDLYKILSACENKELVREILTIGEKLPTSHNSASAYIIKYINEDAEKLFYNLFEKYFYSADHLKAHSKGGKNRLSNYIPAHRKCNTQKGSDDLELCINKNEKIRNHIKVSYNDMVKLNNNGIFKEVNLGTKYLYSIAKAIFKQSGKHKVEVDTSQITTRFTPKLSYRIKDLLTNVKYSLKKLNFFFKNAD